MIYNNMKDYALALLLTVRHHDELGANDVRTILTAVKVKTVNQLTDAARIAVAQRCLALLKTVSDYSELDIPAYGPVSPYAPTDAEDEDDTSTILPPSKTRRRSKPVADPFEAASKTGRVWPREMLTGALKTFYRSDDKELNQMQYDRMRDVLDYLQNTGNNTHKAQAAEIERLSSVIDELGAEVDKQKELISTLRKRTAERDDSVSRAIQRATR